MKDISEIFNTLAEQGNETAMRVILEKEKSALEIDADVYWKYWNSPIIGEILKYGIKREKLSKIPFHLEFDKEKVDLIMKNSEATIEGLLHRKVLESSIRTGSLDCFKGLYDSYLNARLILDLLCSTDPASDEYPEMTKEVSDLMTSIIYDLHGENIEFLSTSLINKIVSSFRFGILPEFDFLEEHQVNELTVLYLDRYGYSVLEGLLSTNGLKVNSYTFDSVIIALSRGDPSEHIMNTVASLVPYITISLDEKKSVLRAVEYRFGVENSLYETLKLKLVT